MNATQTAPLFAGLEPSAESTERPGFTFASLSGALVAESLVWHAKQAAKATVRAISIVVLVLMV